MVRVECILLTWFLAGSSGYSVQSGDSRSNDSIVIRLTAQNDRFTVVITAESDDIAAEVSKGFELTASLKIGSLLENEFTLPLRVNITDDDGKLNSAS